MVEGKIVAVLLVQAKVWQLLVNGMIMVLVKRETEIDVVVDDGVGKGGKTDGGGGGAWRLK